MPIPLDEVKDSEVVTSFSVVAGPLFSELTEFSLTLTKGPIMLGAIVGWMVVGLIAGGLARLLHPGPDGMGLGATMVLGIIGSLIGGAIGYVLQLGTSPYEPGGWILATVGAVLLLAFGWFGTRRHVAA